MRTASAPTHPWHQALTLRAQPENDALIIPQPKPAVALVGQRASQHLPSDAAGPVHAAGANDPWGHDRRGDHSWGNNSGSDDGAPRHDGTARTRAASPIDAAGACCGTRVRNSQGEGPSEKGRGDQEQLHGNSPFRCSPLATPPEGEGMDGASGTAPQHGVAVRSPADRIGEMPCLLVFLLFLEDDIDGLNDLLVAICLAVDDHLAEGLAWRGAN